MILMLCKGVALMEQQQQPPHISSSSRTATSPVADHSAIWPLTFKSRLATHYITPDGHPRFLPHLKSLNAVLPPLLASSRTARRHFIEPCDVNTCYPICPWHLLPDDVDEIETKAVAVVRWWFCE
jgi:hypothetical protein